MLPILLRNIVLRRTILLVAFLVSMVWLSLFFVTPVSAQAITYYGPADTRTRYALESSPTTNATSINVPVFFATQPASAKTVNVNSFRVGTGGLGVRFNGGPAMSSNGSFSIPAGNFTYDPITGFWKANINAVMSGYSGIDFDYYLHFRLSLADTSGYVAYGGGYFQQVNVDYPDRDVGETYSLYMATPCDVRVNTVRNVRFYDLDHENWDNYWFPVTVRITDTTTGAIVATRTGDSYPVPMGQEGILTVSMTFVPGHKYRVDVWDISDSNVIRYDFPFDNIAYAVPVCPTPQWSTSGTSTASPAGVVTTDTPTVTFTHAIRNDLASLDPTSRTINAEIFQTVNGGAATSRGTFSRASGLARGASFSRTDSLTTAANVGNVVCQYVRWSPNAWNNSGAEQTPATCVTIAALPRMSIVGGDGASGGNMACGATAGGFRGRAGTTPGSFAEYGLLTAPGPITSFWSAGVSGSKALTFANSPGATSGGYAGSRCITNLESQLKTGVVPTNYAGGGIPAAGAYQATSTINITGTTNITGGSRLIVADPGMAVNITGNIEYAPGPYARFADIPSVIVIADTIRIGSGVTRLDGLFIARNIFTTCLEAGDTVGAVQTVAGRTTLAPNGMCRMRPLIINGAVISNGTLLTTRSWGGETPLTGPAEAFIMRPDVFLSQYERGKSSFILRTDSETELPPRN